MRDTVAAFAHRVPADEVVGGRPGEPTAQGVTFRIINAKKNGSRFLNLVHMAPLYDKRGRLARIVGCQYGLGMLISGKAADIFQGVVVPDDSATVMEGVSTVAGSDQEPAVVEVLRAWNNTHSKRLASAKRMSLWIPEGREQMIAKMERIMVKTIQKVCVSVDWSKVDDAITKFQGKRSRCGTSSDDACREAKHTTGDKPRQQQEKKRRQERSVPPSAQVV